MRRYMLILLWGIRPLTECMGMYFDPMLAVLVLRSWVGRVGDVNKSRSSEE